MVLISSLLKKIAQSSEWQDAIRGKFGITCHPKEPGEVLDPTILRQSFNILSLMPVKLVKDCGITKLIFSTAMGPNMPYYPNHGYYIDNSVTLNSDIFYHPDVMDDFFDDRGYFLDRPTQTLIHEFAHGYDEFQGNLSGKQDWLDLSGWSPVKKPGLRRLVINQPGQAPVIGEWYYDPKAGFTRFYAKRNPWDDWADSFSFYVGGLKKLPDNKAAYFDQLMKKYS